MTLAHTHKPVAVGARSPIGIAIARRRELRFGSGGDVEGKDLAAAGIIAVVEPAIIGPPRPASVFVNPGTHAHVRTSYLCGGTITPPNERNATSLVGAALGPVDLAAVDVHLGDPHGSGDQQFGCYRRRDRHAGILPPTVHPRRASQALHFIRFVVRGNVGLWLMKRRLGNERFAISVLTRPTPTNPSVRRSSRRSLAGWLSAGCSCGFAAPK